MVFFQFIHLSSRAFTMLNSGQSTSSNHTFESAYIDLILKLFFAKVTINAFFCNDLLSDLMSHHHSDLYHKVMDAAGRSPLPATHGLNVMKKDSFLKYFCRICVSSASHLLKQLIFILKLFTGEGHRNNLFPQLISLCYIGK